MHNVMHSKWSAFTEEHNHHYSCSADLPLILTLMLHSEHFNSMYILQIKPWKERQIQSGYPTWQSCKIQRSSEHFSGCKPTPTPAYHTEDSDGLKLFSKRILIQNKTCKKLQSTVSMQRKEMALKPHCKYRIITSLFAKAAQYPGIKTKLNCNLPNKVHSEVQIWCSNRRSSLEAAHFTHLHMFCRGHSAKMFRIFIPANAMQP